MTSGQSILLKLYFGVSLASLIASCHSPNAVSMQNEKTTVNPLLCDPDSGVCEIPGATSEASQMNVKMDEKHITIVYFTDPICSSCWSIEPQLRKLKLEYGHLIHIEYRMGGLLPDWSYSSGGISKPSDVAHHWDEVSKYYDMPIDGDVWLEDPLDSSYPPSIAFKAAQMQDEQKAIQFLRYLREMVFLQKKNITKWEHLSEAAVSAGLDTEKLKLAYQGEAVKLFENDLKLSKQMGVRGFPTLFISNQNGKQEMVYGARPYTVFEAAILSLYPNAVKQDYDQSWPSLFNTFPTLTANEFATLSGTGRQETEELLEKLTLEHKLVKENTKNGGIWRRHSSH